MNPDGILAEKAILATLAYYDGVDFPLTLFELRENLVNLSRFSPAGEYRGKITAEKILNAIETSELLKKNVGERDGFYFLRGREGIVGRRIERQKISEQKWKIAKKRAFIFRFAPHVRAALVSGSLALGNAKSESDIDILIIAKSGRIWTCRFFAVLFSLIFGMYRRGNRVKNRFCLNHFITDESLKISGESLYNARTYANLVPFVVRGGNVIENFWNKNGWVGNFILNFAPPRPGAANFRSAYEADESEREKRNLSRVGNDKRFKRDAKRLGNALEKFFAFWQKRRIERDPRTYKSGGRVIADASRLEFHPDSSEREILRKYNEKMKELGLAEFAVERDSGLR